MSRYEAVKKRVAALAEDTRKANESLARLRAEHERITKERWDLEDSQRWCELVVCTKLIEISRIPPPLALLAAEYGSEHACYHNREYTLMSKRTGSLFVLTASCWCTGITGTICPPMIFDGRCHRTLVGFNRFSARAAFAPTFGSKLVLSPFTGIRCGNTKVEARNLSGLTRVVTYLRWYHDMRLSIGEQRVFEDAFSGLESRLEEFSDPIEYD